MDKYLVGVDIGGTTAKLGLFSQENFPEFEEKSSIKTYTDAGGCRILPDIDREIKRMADDNGIEMDDIAGIGLGVPGPVTAGEKPDSTVVNGCVNLGWGVKDVAGELSVFTGVKNVQAINDANAAALGEVICGTNQIIAENRGTYQNTSAVFVTLGTGVGGGIVIDGEIVKGAFGSAGEIGHMKIAPQHKMMSKLVGAGIKASGDLEYYVSSIGIARVATAVLTAYKDDSSLRRYRELDAKRVFDAAKNGDGLALRTTDFFFDTLGTGLATVASVIDPDVFIIGGGMAGAGDFLLDGLRWAYRERAFHSMLETEFRLAVLGNDAGVIGAAAAVL